MILNPPQNLEAERSVAAAVVMDKSARNELFTWLAPEDFWRESYATIYRVVRDMESGGQTVDGSRGQIVQPAVEVLPDLVDKVQFVHSVIPLAFSAAASV